MSPRSALDHLPPVSVPLKLAVPWQKQHYFDPAPGRQARFRRRSFAFWGEVAMFPLVRAFLDGCTVQRSPDYRYVFALLGCELAANAVRHTRSGQPGGIFTLHAERHAGAMTLTCRDEGAPGSWSVHHREPLAADPAGRDPGSESGRGLALVAALATRWGDDGRPAYRRVWFRLDDDLAGSEWGRA